MSCKNKWKSQQMRKTINSKRNKDRKVDNSKCKWKFIEKHETKRCTQRRYLIRCITSIDTKQQKDDEFIQHLLNLEIPCYCYTEFDYEWKSNWLRYSKHIGYYLDPQNTGNYGKYLYYSLSNEIFAYFSQFQTIKKDSSCRIAYFEDGNEPKYNIYSYVLNFKQATFASHISKFKPILIKYMTHIFYVKCVDINCNQHTLIYHLKQELEDYDQRETRQIRHQSHYGEKIICYHCDECKKHRKSLDHYIWDFFCNDLKSIILEIKQQIKYQQINYMKRIHKYNDINSRRGWSQYIEMVIDIDGISNNICCIIVDYLYTKTGYPIIDNSKCKDMQKNGESFFESICKFMGDGYVSLKWMEENVFIKMPFEEFYIIENHYPNIVKPKSVYVFNECYFVDVDKWKFYIIGQMKYGENEWNDDECDDCECECKFKFNPNKPHQDKYAYFYYTDNKIIFSTQWLNLWDCIDNNSVKVACYSFIF